MTDSKRRNADCRDAHRPCVARRSAVLRLFVLRVAFAFPLLLAGLFGVRALEVALAADETSAVVGSKASASTPGCEDASRDHPAEDEGSDDPADDQPLEIDVFEASRLALCRVRGISALPPVFDDPSFLLPQPLAPGDQATLAVRLLEATHAPSASADRVHPPGLLARTDLQVCCRIAPRAPPSA